MNKFREINFSQSEKISTNCNYAAWWNWAPELTQDVSIMATMAKTKLTLRAGPFYTLNMSNFLTVSLLKSFILYLKLFGTLK